MPEHALTRRQAFEPLLACTKSRLASMLAARRLPPEHGEFLARAVFDLESDGVALFDPEGFADDQFYGAVRSYLAARAGAEPVDVLGVEADDVEQLAASTSAAELALRRPSLDRVLIQLVTHTEVTA